MDSIEIEKDIPVPGMKQHHRTKYPFKSMAIGDSIFVSSKDDPGGRRLRLAAYSCAYMHKEFRYQFAESTRKGVLGHRIWRVSNGPTEKGHLPNRPLVRDVVEPPAAVELEDSGQAEYEKQQAEDAEEEKTRLEVEVDEWEASGKVGPLLEMAAENGDVPVAEYVASFKSGGVRLKVKRSKKEASK